MNYKLEYTNRKKTLAIIITPKAEVILKVPKNAPQKEIDRFVSEKSKWIEKKLKYFKDNKHLYADKKYIDEEIHRYFGQDYFLKVISDKKDYVEINNQQLIIHNTRIANQFSTKNILKLWYLQMATEYITNRAKELYALFEKDINEYPEITYKKTKSRWGSCSSNGKISFNPELIKQHPKSIDYVIIHEFCHLIEHNHSSKFYKLVADKMPDWKIWKVNLK